MVFRLIASLFKAALLYNEVYYLEYEF